MNDGFKKFLAASEKNRADAFLVAAQRLKLALEGHTEFEAVYADQQLRQLGAVYRPRKCRQANVGKLVNRAVSYEV